jgi:hypothetical protein
MPAAKKQPTRTTEFASRSTTKELSFNKPAPPSKDDFARFEDLTRKLVGVPKSEIDERRSPKPA